MANTFSNNIIVSKVGKSKHFAYETSEPNQLERKGMEVERLHG